MPECLIRTNEHYHMQPKEKEKATSNNLWTNRGDCHASACSQSRITFRGWGCQYAILKTFKLLHIYIHIGLYVCRYLAVRFGT